MRLGLLLENWRVCKRMTLRDFSKHLGISTATLQRIEHGNQCDAVTLMKIFNYLTAEVQL